MADTVGELQVKVTADTSALSSKIQGDAQKAGGGFAKTFAKVGAVAAGVGVAAAAIGTKFAAGAISAAEAAATAEARLDKVAESMGFVGGAYEGATQRAKDYATELSKNIAVEDNTILAVQAKLATFKEVGKTINETEGAFDRATKAAFDLAATGFGSAESNAIQLGKALNDPVKGISALNRAGVTFTEQEKAKIKALVESGQAAKAQDMILSALEKQVGGVAEATANASDKLKVSFNEMQEQVGKTLLPVFNELADKLIPIIESLAEPLGEIAATVGGALAEAFEVVGPLIRPLVEAFAELAGGAMKAIVGALTAMMPALLPVVEILGDLAARIGPVVEKVLVKVAQVFARVVEAVTPLLDPLIDLVFVILDAAWPIFEIVADVVLVLVDALAPLLQIVGSLLKPIGELVNVAFAAIMPILQPLMPVIEALAMVLADVLGRAIGVVITAAGYLIQAWSEVGSFIIGNVLRPLVSAFLSWAENIVGAAATAFSWVPGLGDKLNTAKDAIGTFKTSAEKGIGDAADTIGKKGKEIGKNLVDQGLATMKDPIQQSRYERAGTALGTKATDALTAGINAGQVPAAAAATAVGTTTGKSLIKGLQAQLADAKAAGDEVGAETIAGLIKGVKAGDPKAKAAAAALAQNVTAGARTELGIRSPSRVFEGIGGFVVKGLQNGIANGWSALTSFWTGKIKGLVDGAKSLLGIASPSKVMITMGGNVAEGFGIGLESIGKVNDEFLAKMDKAVKASETKIDKWVNQTRQQLDKAVEAWRDYRDEVFASITGNVNFSTAMRATEDQQKAVRDAERALAEANAKAAAPDASDSDKSAVAAAQAALAEAQAAVKDFEGNLAAMLDQSDFFGTAFSAASDAMIAQFGADSPIWATMRQQMLAAGPVEGAALATYIAQNGLSPEMAERLKNWNMWAGEVAADQADKNKGQGVQIAVDAMAGLEGKIKQERARLVKMGERMGDGVIVGFKDKESDFKRAVRGYINAAYAELGIKSPSRVFAEIGRYTAAGFNQGVEGELEPFAPSVSIGATKLYAPSLSMGDALSAGSVAPTANVRVYLGDKELTDLVDVQIDRRDEHAMDLVIAGRRF